MTPTENGNEIEAHFLELLKAFKNATLITRAFGGGLHGRPMSIGHTEDDGTLWFLTDLQAGKVSELARDPHALVSLAESDKYIVMTGEAELVRDAEKAKSLWKEPFRVWFKGPDDPALTLIRFQPDEGEYWNNAGAQGIKQAFRAAKAYIKGEPMKDVDDPGVHGRVLR
ncbi:MAG TPA: pyridoxamine 5'-phosphate oxidase family protein [Polyangiaceae bacterium]|nr:pyridoxamine 5'-phosphate oxidase family protein [Polyangiaceae bacterium]